MRLQHWLKPHGSTLIHGAACYVVAGDRVLLVHHRGFDKWVPPGGHVEPWETFAQAAQRECREETGLEVRIVSSSPQIHATDQNSAEEPTPFFCDVLHEGFASPCLMLYFF